MGAATLSHFRAAFDENAHLRLACRLHFVSAGRAARTYDSSAGRRSTAGKNFDTHGEWGATVNRESLFDHGDGFSYPPRHPRTSESFLTTYRLGLKRRSGSSSSDRRVLGRPPFSALLADWRFPTKGRFRLKVESSQAPAKITFHQRNVMWEWCFRILRCGRT